MSILKAALARETSERNHIKAVQTDRREEKAAVVAAIHKAFMAEAAEVEKLSLKGDHGKAISIVEAQMPIYAKANLRDHGSPFAKHCGLEIQMGSRIAKEQLRLTVLERDDTNPVRVILAIERSYPCKSETLETFHGHTQPSAMLEKFFHVLARYVAEPVLAPAAQAA